MAKARATTRRRRRRKGAKPWTRVALLLLLAVPVLAGSFVGQVSIWGHLASKL